MTGTPELSSEEWKSLEAVASESRLKPRIPDPHREELIAMGLIEQRLGGLVVTAKGKLALLKQ